MCRDYTPVCSSQRQPDNHKFFVTVWPTGKQENCQKTKAATDYTDFTDFNPAVQQRYDLEGVTAASKALALLRIGDDQKFSCW
jgi:hypothetical protein